MLWANKTSRTSPPLPRPDFTLKPYLSTNMRRQRHGGFQNAEQRDAHALRRSEQVVLYDDMAHTATHFASNAHARTLSNVTFQRGVQEMQGRHRLKHVVFY
jgi:hypothetical protein